MNILKTICDELNHMNVHSDGNYMKARMKSYPRPAIVVRVEYYQQEELHEDQFYIYIDDDGTFMVVSEDAELENKLMKFISEYDVIDFFKDYWYWKAKYVITSSITSRRRRITASTSDMKFQRFIDEVADTATVDLGIRCQVRNDRGSDDYATWGEVTFVFRPDWDNRWVSVHVYFDFADNDFIDNPISCTIRDSWDGHDEDETFSTFSECADYIINTIEHRLVD